MNSIEAATHKRTLKQTKNRHIAIIFTKGQACNFLELERTFATQVNAHFNCNFSFVFTPLIMLKQA